jgi:hypothetical protein
MVRTFKQWKAHVMLWLSVLQVNEKDQPFIENLIQRLPQLRLTWLPKYLADLSLLRKIVEVPPDIFPTPKEIDLWYLTKQEE